jgi:hypothetical protein
MGFYIACHAVRQVVTGGVALAFLQFLQQEAGEHAVLLFFAGTGDFGFRGGAEHHQVAGERFFFRNDVCASSVCQGGLQGERAAV